MAQILNILLMVVAVFAIKSQAFGGIEEKLPRTPAKQDQRNQISPSYNENLDKLVALLKKDTLTALCESEKVNTVWCQYKQLLEFNSVYEQQQKLVKKKSAGSMCWPGLPWADCKNGLVPARSVRAVKNEDDYNYADNDIDTDLDFDTDSETDNYADTDNDDEKRALKCRPGMVNCRRKKKGKRTLETTKPKDCPQGWLFCL